LIKSYEFNSDSNLDSAINEKIEIIKEKEVVINNSIPKPTRIYDIKDIENLNKLNKGLRFDLTMLFEYSKGVEIFAW